MVFNRPQQTQRVLWQILAAKPSAIFVSADGPRKTNPDDREKCAAVRDCIENIPKDIRVQRLYHAENLGCRKCVTTALSWFFGKNEYGIVLEDDTLPDISFFAFCEAALLKYMDEERVMVVSGHNPLGSFPSKTDAVFSRYPYIWGWGSWQRAWRHYRPEITERNLKESKKQVNKWLRSRYAASFWSKAFRASANGTDTWDYQLNYSMCIRETVALVSARNLVANIGFGPDAVHTKNPADPLQNTPIFHAPEVPEFPKSLAPDPLFEKTVIRKLYFDTDWTFFGRLKSVLRPAVSFVQSAFKRRHSAPGQ
jgi:hypothetical protein